MKFKSWDKVVGQKRISTWFAILPVWIDYEVRWLEQVEVMWECRMVPDFFPPCHPRPRWVKIEFLEEWPED